MDGNEQLRNALKSIAQRSPEAGAERLRDAEDDAAMRAAIHEHFTSVRQNRRGYRRMIAVWAVAAVVALTGVVIIRFIAPQKQSATQQVAVVPGDVDANGRVDILDAFQLAREIEAGNTSNGDINGDGLIDLRDVDAIAMRAVSLDSGGAGGQAG